MQPCVHVKHPLADPNHAIYARSIFRGKPSVLIDALYIHACFAVRRGQVATQEETDAAMDLVYQLEALNPTPDATNVNTIGIVAG